MLPAFDSEGNLPPGIHSCTWEEFVARFGVTPHRLNLIAGLNLAMMQLQEAGCSTIYIDGSFVTKKLIPGDFDACWDTNGVDVNKLIAIAPTLLKFDAKRASQKAEYGGELFPAEFLANAAGNCFLEFFQIDRDGNPKGLVAINLRSWQA
jgi:hypothetical protein